MSDTVALAARLKEKALNCQMPSWSEIYDAADALAKYDAAVLAAFSERDKARAELETLRREYATLVESFNREQSARIELVSEVERLKGTLQKAADKLCHYAADYPQPDTLRIINDCDRVLARGYYGVTEASTGDGPVVSDQRAEANARLRPPIAEGAWRHKKRGTTYRIEEPITIQCEAPVQDGEELLAYRAIRDGKLWGRRASEFLDGRFEPIVLIAKEAQPSAEATTNLVNEMVLRGAMQHCEAAATAIRALIDAPAPSADGEGE